MHADGMGSRVVVTQFLCDAQQRRKVGVADHLRKLFVFLLYATLRKGLGRDGYQAGQRIFRTVVQIQQRFQYEQIQLLRLTKVLTGMRRVRKQIGRQFGIKGFQPAIFRTWLQPFHCRCADSQNLLTDRFITGGDSCQSILIYLYGAGNALRKTSQQSLYCLFIHKLFHKTASYLLCGMAENGIFRFHR